MKRREFHDWLLRGRACFRESGGVIQVGELNLRFQISDFRFQISRSEDF